MDSSQRDRLISLGRALVDQQAARIVVEPNARQAGFWFGGGNLMETSEGRLHLVGRYRNVGDSTTGLGMGDRGLELAILSSDDNGETFARTMSLTKEELSRSPGEVVSIEGTALIARERGKELEGEFSQSFLARARRFLSLPGLSVGPEATIAARLGAHALHDPTEGGLLNGLWEMSQACGLALDIWTEAIFIYDQTRRLCQRFGLDPLGLLASGALIIACAPRMVKNLCRRLDQADIISAVIGRARRGLPAVHFDDGRSVKKSVTDQILKVFKKD